MKNYIKIGLVISLILNLVLTYEIIDSAITLAYTKISHEYMKKDINNTVRLLNIILQDTPRNKIELFGLKMSSSECLVKEGDASSSIGALEFLFDDNVVKKVKYIE